jgi:spheroidene monooxygenase
VTQVVTLSVFRFEGVVNRLWAFAQMQFSRGPLKRLPDVGFVKMFGTGTGEGFTPVPNFGVYALMTTWPSLDIARRRLAESAVFQRYRAHALEHATLHLASIASRGLWDGGTPFVTDKAAADGPGMLAVLTRATVKPRHVIAFWRHTPDISETVRGETHMHFKIGMGEVPWLQQVTFSVWDDVAAMKAFAYKSASHGGAVRAVREGGFFAEELYARFRVLAAEGCFGGRRFEPLAMGAVAGLPSTPPPVPAAAA